MPGVAEQVELRRAVAHEHRDELGEGVGAALEAHEILGRSAHEGHTHGAVGDLHGVLVGGSLLDGLAVGTQPRGNAGECIHEGEALERLAVPAGLPGPVGAEVIPQRPQIAVEVLRPVAHLAAHLADQLSGLLGVRHVVGQGLGEVVGTDPVVPRPHHAERIRELHDHCGILHTERGRHEVGAGLQGRHGPGRGRVGESTVAVIHHVAEPRHELVGLHRAEGLLQGAADLGVRKQTVRQQHSLAVSQVLDHLGGVLGQDALEVHVQFVDRVTTLLGVARGGAGLGIAAPVVEQGRAAGLLLACHGGPARSGLEGIVAAPQGLGGAVLHRDRDGDRLLALGLDARELLLKLCDLGPQFADGVPRALHEDQIMLVQVRQRIGHGLLVEAVALEASDQLGLVLLGAHVEEHGDELLAAQRLLDALHREGVGHAVLLGLGHLVQSFHELAVDLDDEVEISGLGLGDGVPDGPVPGAIDVVAVEPVDELLHLDQRGIQTEQLVVDRLL